MDGGAAAPGRRLWTPSTPSTPSTPQARPQPRKPFAAVSRPNPARGRDDVRAPGADGPAARSRLQAPELPAHQAGITTSEELARREAYLATYGDEHVGKDTYSDLRHVEAGITTTAEAARRAEYLAAYGDEWEGRDVKDNLGPGMIPDAGAGQGIGFEEAYGTEWEGRDVKDHLAPGPRVE